MRDKQMAKKRSVGSEVRYLPDISMTSGTNAPGLD